MSDRDTDDIEAPVSAEPRRARRPVSAAALGAFSAGVMLVVILLYLAY